MTFLITHVDGSMEQPPDISGFPALLDELRFATVEHGDVAVGHESGWTLTVLRSGRIIWENVDEDGAPQHGVGSSREEVLALMAQVATGDITAVAAGPWIAGYGP